MAKINALRRGIRGMMHRVKDEITPSINDIKSFVRNPNEFRVRNPRKIEDAILNGLALSTIGVVYNNNQDKINRALFNAPPQVIDLMRDAGYISPNRASKAQRRYSNAKNKLIQAVPQLQYNNNMGASNSATKKRMKKSKYS